MSNENNNPLLPPDENWLDDILGTETPKAELSAEELASMSQELDLDRIMEESWDTDQQTLSEIQDSVAQELPAIPLEEQPTSRIPFADPSVSVSTAEEAADSPTIAIPVVSEPMRFFSAASDLTDPEEPALEGTQQFALPEEALEGTQQFVLPEEPEADTPVPLFTDEELFGTSEPITPLLFTDEALFSKEEPEEKAEELTTTDASDEAPAVAAEASENPISAEAAEASENPIPTEAAEAAAAMPFIEPFAPIPPEPVQPESTAKPKAPKPEAPKPEGRRKIRPGFKKGYGLLGIPHVVSTIIWLFIIVAAGVSLGRMVWVCCADLMAFGKPDKEITITITEEDVKEFENGKKEVNIDAIAQKLGDAGLIKYPKLFKFFAQLTHKDQSISPGTYTLNCYFDYNAMINAMSYHEKPKDIVTVLIPEGYNCAQIFALLQENEVCTVELLEECAAKGDETLNQYWFLEEDIPWGEKYCLEGFLFPDTYDFYTNEDPAVVLNKMLSNFDNRFTDKMKTNLETIKSTYGLSLREVLTIASMVEEEAVGATKSTGEFEGYVIAAVYYNRLVNKNGEFAVPYMGCDATVYYAMEDYFGEAGELTAEHLATDSPYNTRLYPGLPPGPITNPGSYSIYAALEPKDVDYHYYCYDPEEKCHKFAVYESEFNQLKKELGY